ncbi:Arylsulfatase [Pirellulimonas nuda]|uniref:Arylsulfatase n=1 Tax=Pirellulimonas nuda TaxID=2528009 RepID=A0A518D950_9BACT|nr:sulfatase-like hydrolase/transferase [Pirellulimonas nuda]QDU87984.1 Arylsulfatase [Pirellulimonas nuda]
MRYLLLLLPACLPIAAAGATPRPNIVLIMADDVGIEALGCYGGVSYRTPQLDALACGGVRFTHAYSQPLCTPTRVQLMTGKYNHRNWKAFGVLDPGERTFGHRLRDAGYATAIFGKWQLRSYDPPDFPGAADRRDSGMHAKDAGFDEYALHHAGHTEDKGSRYANPTMLEGVAGQGGELKTYPGRFGEDIWVAKTIDFLERHREQPAFVYYPMALPHWPFVPTPNSDGWNPEEPAAEALRYAADMIEYMDTAVGNLVAGLDAKGLRDNTVVIFYSDNGAHMDVTSRLADGRAIAGGKGTSRQTGVHVPLIVSWPGRVLPAQSDSLVDASDFYPTLCELAGAPASADGPRDGISFVPELLGRAGPKREAVFCWYDPRPGHDKTQFSREVFALDRRYKYFRDGRLFRLSDRPLEETLVEPGSADGRDRAAVKKLKRVIDEAMEGVAEPPLVDAYGQPTPDPAG